MGYCVPVDFGFCLPAASCSTSTARRIRTRTVQDVRVLEHVDFVANVVVVINVKRRGDRGWCRGEGDG